MALPKRQHPFDWITQCWNISLGRSASFPEDAWLLGPIGAIGERPEDFIDRFARAEGLRQVRGRPGAGLLPSFAQWNFILHPLVEDFYGRTSAYRLEVESKWTFGVAIFGRIAKELWTRRVMQFQLPETTKGVPIAFESEVVDLVDHDGRVVYTLWLRRAKDSQQMVFYGLYSAAQLPSGEIVIKSVFPLPQGNATVIFRLSADAHGNLHLISEGQGYGDPGFYFVVEDRRGDLWNHFLSHFRQRIHVHVDSSGALRASHTFSFWSLRLYTLNYTVTLK